MTEFYLSGGLLIAIPAASILSILFISLTDGGVRGRQRAWNGVFLSLLLVLLIGLRPISGLYVDMMTYATAFERSKLGISQVSLGDPLFDLFSNVSAAIISAETYFFLCALFYVVPKALACRQMFGSRAAIVLAAMASSFSFYGFATNGLANGIAASLALLAIAWPRLAGQVVLGALAIAIHLSLLAPLAAYVIAGKVKSIGKWLTFWFAAIPVSFALPSSALSRLASLQFDERTGYFSNAEAATGFRLDFIIYSGIAVLAIVYWKYFRKIEDPLFERLACTYLIANGSWILINQVAFSNRFAYLSWFILEIVVLLPLRRERVREIAPIALCLVLFNAVLTWIIV